MRTPLTLLLPALVALAACTDAPRPSVDPEDVLAGALPYRLDAPDAVVTLPAELREVSGLTVLPSGNLGAVQDERGTVFEIDAATGAVVDRLRFAGAGDFEGVALAGDALWVLRSDGDLYRLARDSAGAPTARKVETLLRSRNDTEGLAYDAASGRLLVACKEWPGEDADGEDYAGVRAVYAFDLATETVAARPLLLLDRARVDGTSPFKPSALAIHPSTGRLYVLSSVRRALAVVDTDGTLLGVADLTASAAPQPEGLAFGPDGTLYVASEGPTGPGTLLRFSPVAR